MAVPTLPVVERLLAAAGRRLIIDSCPTGPLPSGLDLHDEDLLDRSLAMTPTQRVLRNQAAARLVGAAAAARAAGEPRRLRP